MFSLIGTPLWLLVFCCCCDAVSVVDGRFYRGVFILSKRSRAASWPGFFYLVPLLWFCCSVLLSSSTVLLCSSSVLLCSSSVLLQRWFFCAGSSVLLVLCCLFCAACSVLLVLRCLFCAACSALLALFYLFCGACSLLVQQCSRAMLWLLLRVSGCCSPVSASVSAHGQDRSALYLV